MKETDLKDYAAKGYNRVPLAREVLADLDTPVSTYIKLASRPYTYLLESVQGGEKWGRYSIIGLPCHTVLRTVDLEVTIEEDGEVVERVTVDDPLEMVREFCRRYRAPEVAGLPRFTGGIVGYFGYDTVRYIEPHLGLCQKPDPTGTPDIMLMISDEVLVFDNLTGRLHIITHVDPGSPGALERGTDRLDQLVEQLRENSLLYVDDEVPVAYGETGFTSGFSESEFKEAVKVSREYIRNGDIMQVVLSQRLSIKLRADPIDVYRALRTLNPSPYMYFLDLDGFRIVGSSPEILVRCEDGKVTVRPIAGTRRRGHDDEEDRAMERELLADPKELAEHLMLVDLGRNDVGRVARTGSVSVTERMLIERYSHVMHIVSNVQGRLRPGLDALDVLRATFPAGTVSGAPKVRAMEIIDELEPEKRGIYAGAVGYISWNGNMDTAIAIRTAVITGEMLHIQAGAGIVADSIPDLEWKETLNKGRAIFKAVEMASRGLDRDLSLSN